jgi:hypothetical protein
MDALLLLFLYCTYFIFVKHAYFKTLMKYIWNHLVRLIASYNMVSRYVQYNGHGLTIRVNFMVNVCVWGGGGGGGGWVALDPMVP